MSYDVFISHESSDRNIAQAVCNALENARIRCWMAPRDVLAGKSYAAQIDEAIQKCHALVLVFSARADQSEFVKREVESALSYTKIIIPFRIEDVMPSGEMRFYVKNLHWLDAIMPSVEAHLPHLVETVSRLLGNEGAMRSLKKELPRPNPKGGFEYRTEPHILGLPLVHVALDLPSLDGRSRHARGIIAIGDKPIGVIAIGLCPCGIIALGTFAVGVLPIGLVSIGVFSAGALAVGFVSAYGMFAVAPIAIGAVAIGYYCSGEFLFGWFVHGRNFSDLEAVAFFQPWLKTQLHVLLVTLCFLAYLGPKMIRFLKSIVAGRSRS